MKKESQHDQCQHHEHCQHQQQNNKMMNAQIKQNNTLQNLARMIKLEDRKHKVETMLMRDLRELFESNGARNLFSLHNVNPLLNERTLFLSKAIRL